MIQRIQTVYWLLSSMAIACMFFLPLASIAIDEFHLQAGGVYNAGGGKVAGTALISVLLAIEIIFTFTIIFLYKKRGRQMMMAKLNLLLLTLLIAVIFFYTDYVKLQLNLSKESLVSYEFAALLPVVAIVLNYLAIRAVKKDDDLVRAADRLR